MIYSSLLLFFLLNSSSQSNNIDWCYYFQRLNIYRPECKYHELDRSATSQLIPLPNHFPICSPHYSYCTANRKCGDGKLRCIDTINYRECCAPFKKECPALDYLNFRCVVNNPTNWCREHSECDRSPRKLCCPTSCNYNICI